MVFSTSGPTGSLEYFYHYFGEIVMARSISVSVKWFCRSYSFYEGLEFSSSLDWKSISSLFWRFRLGSLRVEILSKIASFALPWLLMNLLLMGLAMSLLDQVTFYSMSSSCCSDMVVKCLCVTSDDWEEVFDLDSSNIGSSIACPDFTLFA